MNFEPKTEKQIAEAGLWPAGTYDFEVAEATDTQSSAGNDMIELSVRLFNQEGKSRRVRDWLVDTEGGAYKIRHFAEATGMLDEYETGDMDASDMVGKTGQCKVFIKKDKGGAYPDQNGIADYIKFDAATTAAPRTRLAPTEQMEDDEIPF